MEHERAVGVLRGRVKFDDELVTAPILVQPKSWCHQELLLIVVVMKLVVVGVQSVVLTIVTAYLVRGYTHCILVLKEAILLLDARWNVLMTT